MPTKCCVFGCKNIDTSKSRQDLKISFHKVPKLEPERSKWLKVIPRKNGHFVLKTTETLSVCSGHFPLSDFDPDPALLRRRLKSGVKPSIFEAYEKFALENNSFSNDEKSPKKEDSSEKNVSDVHPGGSQAELFDLAKPLGMN